MDDTPAMEAGVEAGDFITHVDGEALLGLTLEQAVDLMRGPVGSEIVITVVREGATNPSTSRSSATASADGRALAARGQHGDPAGLHLQRSDLSQPARRAAGNDRRGRRLENLNGVVIDLRNNAGGLLSEAIRVTDAFLEQGEIVSTRGREPQDGDRFNATPGDMIEGRPMVVLSMAARPRPPRSWPARCRITAAP
jgi:carboxyl-terminal processing protease